MELILQKFAGKIDAQSLVKTVEELKSEYLDDGLTKEDIPPIVSRLMMETMGGISSLVRPSSRYSDYPSHRLSPHDGDCQVQGTPWSPEEEVGHQRTVPPHRTD